MHSIHRRRRQSTLWQQKKKKKKKKKKNKDPNTNALATTLDKHIGAFDPSSGNKMPDYMITRLSRLGYAVVNGFFDTRYTHISQNNGSETRIDALVGPCTV